MGKLLLTLAILRGADGLSSCDAFARGFKEGNPFMPSSCTGQMIAQGAIGGAQIWSLKELSKTHKKLAVTLAIIGIGVEGWATEHNLRLGR